MSSFWSAYGTIIEFSMFWAIFALAQYASHMAGILNFATPTFAAVGAFGAAFLMKSFGLPIEVGLIIGAALGGIIAVLLSYPLLRLSSHWMALATVAVLTITRVIVLNLPAITGGISGTLIPRTITPAHILVVLILTAWVFFRLRRSRLGLSIEAVRTDPDVASSMGINPILLKRKCLFLAGLIAGIAGVIYANLVQFISPDTFTAAMSTTLFASVILGGAEHWLGPIVGGIIFSLLPELLRMIIPRGENIINGLILLITMIYVPLGLIHPLLKNQDKLKLIGLVAWFSNRKSGLRSGGNGTE